MNPLQMSDLIALCSLALAALGMLVGFWRGSRGNAARDQLVSDKLDRAVEMAKETRDTVREMSRKLDDHGLSLARHTEQIASLFQRVERLEKGRDLGNRPEGTD